MPRSEFIQLLQSHPEVGIAVAGALSEQVRIAHKKYRTPMLEQKSVPLGSGGLNIPAVILAAGVESYYRSALNAQINYALTGIKASMFPNMHIQVPTRISYILGFKGLRQYIDSNNIVSNPTITATTAAAAGSSTSSSTSTNTSATNAIRVLAAIMPGVIMTPISSLLEASNAGHLNPEPIYTRYVRSCGTACI
jgi:hypothetical protein